MICLGQGGLHYRNASSSSLYEFKYSSISNDNHVFAGRHISVLFFVQLKYSSIDATVLRNLSAIVVIQTTFSYATNFLCSDTYIYLRIIGCNYGQMVALLTVPFSVETLQ